MSNRLIFALAVAAALACSSLAPAEVAPGKPKDKPPTSSPSADETALRGALKTLAKALQDGDRDEIRKVIYAANPTEQKMVDAMAAMAAEIAHLNKAAAKAFGEQEA